MRTVPFAEGDLTWVFPEGSVTPELTAALGACGERLVEIAGLLVGGRAGWTGSGLEYDMLPSGRCSLSGWAENPQVTFRAELVPPGFYQDKSPAWEVTADISVRCDAPHDCGMHELESYSPNSYTTAEDAVAALERATSWLLARCQAVPPDEWRARDPVSGHA